MRSVQLARAADAEPVAARSAGPPVDDSTHELRRERGLPAWVLSLVFHFVLLVALALILRPVTRGVDRDPGRQGSIVLVSQANAQTEYLSENDVTRETVDPSSAAPASSEQSPFPDSNDSPLETSGVFPTDRGIIGPAGGLTSALPDAGDLLNGWGGNGEYGQQTTTQVFGAKGTGSKFVYVFDRSSSMEGFGGRPMAAAKRELIASLSQLHETNQFQIIFYNDSPSAFNPNPGRQPRLMFGDQTNREDAQRFVNAIRGAGGTRHMEALKLALSMGPDVIFFLTDAQEPRLSEDDLYTIRRRNRSSASINAIEFGTRSRPGGTNFLGELAHQNGGQYVYVDVTQLRAADR